MDEIKPRNVFLVILWSFGLYILMYTFQYIGTAIASWKSGQSFEAIISGKFESVETDLIISLTALIMGVPIVFLVTRFLWGRNFEWMRLQFNLKLALIGLVLGLFLPFVVLALLKVMGVAKMTWQPHVLQSKQARTIIIGYTCMAIFSGIAEEVVFRGMVVREIALPHGWLIATVIGGLYFGAAHLIAKLQNLTLVDALWVLLAGTLISFLFVAMYRRGQSLWLPIGFHIAWNFCLKGVMGIRMSGNEAKVGLFNVELAGSSFLTGGNFGIEASVISLIIYIVVAFLFVSVSWGGYTELLGNR